MKHPFRALLNRLTASASSKVALGSVLGHAVSLLAMPLVARIYGPDAVGVFATCLAVATIVGSVIALRLERVLALPADDSDAACLAVGGVVTAFCFSVFGAVFGVVVVLLRFDFSVVATVGTALLAFLTAVGAVLLQYAVRSRSYAVVARRNALQPTVTAVGQVLGGLIASGSLPLIAAAAVGKVAGLILPLRLVISDLNWNGVGSFLSQFGCLLSRYRELIVLGSVAGLANTASLQILVPITGFYFSDGDAGIVAMSVMIFSAPIVVIANAVGQVFLGNFSHSVRNSLGNASQVFVRASIRLAAMGVALGLFIALLAPVVLPVLLGEQWGNVVGVSIALAPLFAVRFAVSPLAHTLVVLERQGWQLALDASRLAGIISVFMLSSELGLSLMLCIFVYACWSSLAYLVQWLLCWRAVRAGI